jgi:hypothetical protein
MFGSILFMFFLSSVLSGGGDSKAAGGVIGAGILGVLGSIIAIKNALKTLGWIKDDKEKEKDEKEKDGVKLKQDVNPTLIRNKSLAIMKKKIDSGSASDEEVEDFNTVLKCTFDENGKELSPEDQKKKIEGLSDDVKKRLDKNLKTITKDKETIEKLKDEIKNVSDSEASAAFEECKAKRVELHTKEKEVELLEQKNKELEKLGENPDESKKKDIEDSFNARIEALKKDAKVKIDGFKEKAKKFLNSPSDTKELDKELKELEKQKEKLAKDEKSGNAEIEKQLKHEFEKNNLNGLTIDVIENPTGDDEKRQVEEYLKQTGITDKNLFVAYKKYNEADSDTKEQAKQELDSALSKEREARIKILDDKISKKKKEIETVNDKKSIDNTQQEPKKGEEPKNQQKSNQNEVELLNDDGEKTGEKIIKKEDGSYKKVDKDGVESDATEDDFKDAKSEYEDFDGDEENSQEDNDADKDLDPDHEESEEEKKSEEGKKADRDESGKRVNPAKNWHKRKKKNGKGSTKSYYNSKGDSISAKDFREKMENYKAYVQKHKKTKHEESFNISNFLKDKLIVERFYPRDITNYLREHLK